MASGLALEETELRLGLPGGRGGGGGGEGGEAVKSSGKRGFAEAIDLKLQLQTPVDAEEEEAAEKGRAALLKHKCGSADDPEKSPAPKAQVVGWPPVRSFRKNILSSVHRTEKGSDNSSGSSKEEGGGDKSGNPGAAAALVKVSMDGAPYLRKVDLKMYRSYQELSLALQKMFSSFTCIGNYYGTQQGGLMMKEEMSKVMMDVLSGSEYVPTYQDKDGDWMLVGDVPWEMFVDSCKRLRIMKGSEAIGLAPRAMEKCKLLTG